MIRSIVLHDYEERSEPPVDEALKLSVVDDIVYVAIGKVEEDFDTTTFKTDKQVAVFGVDFANAIMTLVSSEALDA